MLFRNIIPLRLLIVFPFFTFVFKGTTQDSTYIVKAAILLDFNHHLPVNLYGYNNRVVPWSSSNPYYVSISYENSKLKRYEYFRIDSTHYLRYEFFKHFTNSSNEGLKSSGILRVTDTIYGNQTVVVKKVTSPSPFGSVYEAYKELAKEGIWKEYEDAGFDHTYWTGLYINNKKAGIWSKYIYLIGEDFLLEQINYDKGNLRIYKTNISQTLSSESLKEKLKGKWLLSGCDSEKDKKMLYRKSEKHDSNYIEPQQSFYLFENDNKFRREREEGCNKFRETALNATWDVYKNSKGVFIKLKFMDNKIWILRVLYLDKDNNLITERQ